MPSWDIYLLLPGRVFGQQRDCSKKDWAREWAEETRSLPRSCSEILEIPLSETDHEDMLVWKGELSGEFSVRSAYKLLHNASLDLRNFLIQTEMKEFYKKLWGLQLPPKIIIIIWRISWDFIPNFVNLRFKRIISDDRCPRCCSWEEYNLHIFHDCPGFSREVTMPNVDVSVMPYGRNGGLFRRSVR